MTSDAQKPVAVGRIRKREKTKQHLLQAAQHPSSLGCEVSEVCGKATEISRPAISCRPHSSGDKRSPSSGQPSVFKGCAVVDCNGPCRCCPETEQQRLLADGG